MYSHPTPIGSQGKRLLALAFALTLLGGILVTELMIARAKAPASQFLHNAAVTRGHPAAGLLPVANQPDIQLKQRTLADKVLRALPEGCRQSLANLYVNYDKNPSNRGLGGASVIIVAGRVPDAEFMALLTHECGHVIDLGWLKGTSASGKSNFLDGNSPIWNDDPSVEFYEIGWVTSSIQQPGLTEADFVSGYAMSDPFEDFAESFAFFALHKKEFARLATKNANLKAKYDFMQKYVFTGSDTVADSKFIRGNKAPWDVTKLPYVWHAKK
jgi:hypothetical protein